MPSDWAGLIRAESEALHSSEPGADGSSPTEVRILPTVKRRRAPGIAFQSCSLRDDVNEHLMSLILVWWNSGTLHCTACCLSRNDPCCRPDHPLECQMSKRKPATASKHARGPKIAAKAQRTAQAIVRSPKDSRLRSAGAGTTKSLPKRHNDSKQEAPLVENPVTALQNDCKPTMTNNDSKKGFDFSSATANVRAYQAKLLEMAQANIQFAFEFSQRLATIRSPVEFPSVIAEFTSKRIAMFRKYSKEITELSTKRWTA